MAELQARARAPASTAVDALDRQLRSSTVEASTSSSSSGSSDAATTDLDAGLSRLLERSFSRAPGRLDTLRLLQRYNHGLPYLRGQTVLVKVLSVDEERVLVDTGYNGITEVPRDQVSVAHVYTEDGMAPLRPTTHDVQPGDLLKLRVEALYTPYGDMQLTPLDDDAGARRRAVWAELQRRYEAKTPVEGRVLNDCPGGYAVGVGGVVGFLPYALTTAATAQRIGTAQPFLIVGMDVGRQRFTLRDASMA